MVKKAMILALLILLLPDALFADPRTETVKFICGNQLDNNVTLYVPNFVATMENLSAQVRTLGFGTAATGSGADASYGLAQCYSDLSLGDCVLCQAEARTILDKCYSVNGGRIYKDGCFMRFENYSFFQEYTGPHDHAICGNITGQDSAFQESARQALSQAVSAAPKNNGYARAEVALYGRADDSAYVLADCRRTINATACQACLENATSSILGCLPSSEGRALHTGCFVRYSDRNFLNPIPDQNQNGNSRGTKETLVILIPAVSAATLFIIGAVIGVYSWKKRAIRKKRQGDAEKLVSILNNRSLNFKYSTLEKATGGFDEANKLGQGGFGAVYKGDLPDGREIAVKRLYVNTRLRAADFYNEVNIISGVEHKNLVRLLGCSCLGPESLLVFEFFSNKSLDRFIFDSSKGKELNWEKRLEIIMGTAKGLVYLHENTKSRIIHRDIKVNNILLDSKLRAKIADFGLARSFQEDKSHISTAIAGTLGYMAPEYLANGQLTEKADVYSFGVLLLEIVTGRPNNRSQTQTSEYSDSLLTTAWKHFQQRTVEELFDPNLMPQSCQIVNIKNEILRVVHVGLLCTQEIASLRPTMSKALLMLLIKEDLPAPTRPPFIYENTVELQEMGENLLSPPLNYGNAVSVATISQSKFYPR